MRFAGEMLDERPNLLGCFDFTRWLPVARCDVFGQRPCFHGRERYDALMSPHSHFVCSKCGRVIDVFLDSLLPTLTEELYIDGAKEINSFTLLYYGICDQC